VPNSLTELNQYANTSAPYTDTRAYAITFSANAAANTSTTIDEDQSFVLPTGIDIASVLSQPGNITYSINTAVAGNVVATWPTLPWGVSNTVTANTVSITGVFSGESWLQAKAVSIVMPDRETATTLPATISYPNPANTAQTLTWSWTNSITIANTNPDLTLTNAYNFAEDVGTPFVFSVDDLDPTATYTLTFDQSTGNTGIITVNGVSAGLGNIATLAGNRATVNAGNVTFFPEPDSASNAQVLVSAVKTNPFGNVTFANNVVCNLTCTSSHSQYSLTTAYNFAEDVTTDMVYSITDTDPQATGYSVTFAQSTGNTGVFFVNNVSQGVGNAAVITGSKATVNAANVAFLPPPDYTGNVGLTYTQIKNNLWFGNITQAANLPVSLTCNATHTNYNFATSGTYDEDTFKSFSNLIGDTDARATSYSTSLQQTSGNVGTWYLNGAIVGPANTVLSFSNSKSNINSANIQYLPAVDNTGNITITYNQSKVNSVFGNITQAANLAGNYTIGNTNPEIANMIGVNRSFTGNTITDIFQTTTPAISDGPDYGQTYTISLTSPLGRFGNSTGYFTATSNISSLANTLVLSGNTQQINAEFANIKFAPLTSGTANTTFTYTQSRNSQQQLTTTNNLTVIPAPLSNVYTFTANTAWTPTWQERVYGLANVVVVGGGGGAVWGTDRVPPAGGSAVPYVGAAGGGGEVRWNSNLALSDYSYNVVVGAAGVGNSTATLNLLSWANSDGGNSSITGPDWSLSAAGGDNGQQLVTIVVNNPPYSPTRYTLVQDWGGNGGGNLTVGNITGGHGGGAGGGSNSWIAGSGVNSGTSVNGSQGGGGGARGGPGLGITIGGNGAAGVTTVVTGNLVLGGGGASRAQYPGANGTPGGNSYGLGGSSLIYGQQDGATGVVIINIS